MGADSPQKWGGWAILRDDIREAGGDASVSARAMEIRADVMPIVTRRRKVRRQALDICWI
jgi:hypothetical protein